MLEPRTNKQASAEVLLLRKKSIGYEFCYRNSYSSKIYARARINALQLEEHKGRGKESYDTTCKLCGEEEENIVHFTIKCSKLKQKIDIDY